MDEMAQVNHTYLCECNLDIDHRSNLSDEEWSNVDALRKQLPGHNYIVNPDHVSDNNVVIEKHEKYWIVK